MRGVGGRAEHALHGRGLIGDRPDVDLGGMAVEDQIGGGGLEADQDRAVDLGGEYRRIEDAGDVEPLAVDPDPLTGQDHVDPEPLGGGRAQHADGLGASGGVEPAALAERGAHRGSRLRVAARTLSALVWMLGMCGLR